MKADVGLFEMMYMRGDITLGQYIGIDVLIVVIILIIALIVYHK